MLQATFQHNPQHKRGQTCSLCRRHINSAVCRGERGESPGEADAWLIWKTWKKKKKKKEEQKQGWVSKTNWTYATKITAQRVSQHWFFMFSEQVFDLVLCSPFGKWKACTLEKPVHWRCLLCEICQSVHAKVCIGRSVNCPDATVSSG